MTRELIHLSLLGILFFSACGTHHEELPHVPQPTDSLYTAQAAMRVYGMAPERALSILDSALVIGNVSTFEADYLRAKIYASSMEGLQWSKAYEICENLLQHDSTRTEDKSTVSNRRKVLGVMMDASRKMRNDEDWLRCAIELASLSREEGMETEALRMEAEIGAVLTRLGRREEGMSMLGQTIEALRQGPLSVDRLDAGIVARKRRIVALDQAGSYQEVISDALAILTMLENYESNPGAYQEDSFRLPQASSASRSRYCSFYRAQAQTYLAIAYTRITPPNLDVARTYVRQAEASDYGRSLMGRWNLSSAWKALGEWDKVLAVDDDIERQLGADTLCTDFATVLLDRAQAAKVRGRYFQALDYLDRHSHLKDLLNEKRHETDAHEYAARYHALQQDRQIQEEKARSAQKDTTIAVILAVLVAMCLFALSSFRRRRTILEKNRALVRMMGELNEARDAKRNSGSQPDRELFDLMDSVIRKEKLYADIKLQRQDILDRFDISRHTLNSLFTAYADGQSFPAYINNLRLQDAIHLLQEEPELSIQDIADAVGFSPATFREQFKKQFGMTPTEYRQST